MAKGRDAFAGEVKFTVENILDIAKFAGAKLTRKEALKIFNSPNFQKKLREELAATQKGFVMGMKRFACWKTPLAKKVPMYD